MAFWNKKKDTEDKPKSELEIEMSDELRAITEALEETKNEKEAKAKRRAEENARVVKELQEINDQTLENASEYMEHSVEDEEGFGAAFYMVVENPADFEPVNEGNVLVEGTVYGKVFKGDKVYLFQPDNDMIEVTVDDIRTEPGVHAESAKNRHCIIELNGKGISDSLKYAVLCDKAPAPIDPEEQISSNPRLVGLTLDFNRFRQDPEYFTLLVNVIIKSSFITHARVEGERIGIMSISDSQNPDQKMIPVYTDELSLSFNELDIEDEEIGNLVVSFADLANIVTTSPHEGFVINPFGPVSIKIPEELIKDIMKSPNYSKIAKDTKIGTPAPQPGPQNRIMISIPMENNEYKGIKQAISKHCSMVADIKRVGMAMKTIEGGKDMSYLCIVDCPESKEDECFTGLFAAVKPSLMNGHRIEFMRYDEAPFADDYFARQPLIYTKIG